MDSIRTLYASPTVTPVSSPVKAKDCVAVCEAPPDIPVFEIDSGSSSDEDDNEQGSDIIVLDAENADE